VGVDRTACWWEFHFQIILRGYYKYFGTMFATIPLNIGGDVFNLLWRLGMLADGFCHSW